MKIVFSTFCLLLIAYNIIPSAAATTTTTRLGGSDTSALDTKVAAAEKLDRFQSHQSATTESSRLTTTVKPSAPAKKLPVDNNADILQGSATTLSNLVGAASEPEAAPTVTSVHQVWTSRSSGNLNELSPELISKLRADVPFLAAYALRPRLVGASQNEVGDTPSPSKQLEAGLQTGASSPSRSRDLVPQLGDFSEFKFVTSSTSKSEHHHKQKTSFKRRDKDDGLSLKKRVLTAASQLVRRKRKREREPQLSGRKSGGGKSTSASKQRTRLATAASKRRRKSSTATMARANRMSRKLNARNLQRHLNIIKHGRYYQEQSISAPPTNSGDGGNQASAGGSMKVDTTLMGADKTTTMQMIGLNSDGVKGDSPRGKEPFYTRAKPSSSPKVEHPNERDEEGEGERSVNRLDDDGQREPSSVSGGRDDRDDDDKSDEAVGRKQADETDTSDDEGQLDEPPTPKRVGDDDVEEGGDTVMVEPKFDGVDDDPEVPTEEEEERERDNEGGEREHPPKGKEDEQEERGRRVNRERPNNDGKEAGDASSAGGGGLGATLGGGRAGGAPSSSENGSDDDERPERVSPGVEFAKDGEGDKSGADKSSGASSAPAASSDNSRDHSGGKGDRTDDDDTADNDDEGRRNASGGSEGAKGSRGDHSLGDVDYQDEIERRTAGSRNESSHGRRENDDCNDGSYSHDHHNDHHHDHRKWLKEAIPGEPGEDYPTLSRVNVTNFDCRSDQKYPGYYADVESRCQVFHICQADGRQDSFLCPNGTIFSQISRVCVWWNSFDCEDAPKYYHLNELLFKTTPSTSTRLRPLDGAANGADDDGTSSIDSLIGSMRRNKGEEASLAPSREGGSAGEDPHPPAVKGGGSRKRVELDSDDEATIQRKSTNEDSFASSRLRDVASAGPRRKRRASVRQAPPKLKSRRVSRNSRRRKLRHGIKPKRRA